MNHYQSCMQIGGSDTKARLPVQKRSKKISAAKSIPYRRVGSFTPRSLPKSRTISKTMPSSRPSFAVVKGLSRKFTNSLSEMLAAGFPVLQRFQQRSLLFSTSTFLAIDPGADKDHVVWLYVDVDNTKVCIVIERSVWEISGGVMIWTELPDDEFDGMTVDDFVCCLKDQRWTLVCQSGPISKLSIEAKNAFESYLNDSIAEQRYNK